MTPSIGMGTSGDLAADFAALGARTKEAMAALQQLAAQVKKAGGGGGGEGGGGRGGFAVAVPGGGLGSIAAALGPEAQAVQQAMSVVVDSLKQMASAILGVPDMIRPFVEAFNPTVIQQYDQAIRNLMATVGRTLEPAMQALLNFVRVLNDAVAGPLDLLRPALSDLWSHLTDYLLPAVRLVAEVLSQWIPQMIAISESLRFFLDAHVAVVEIMRLFFAILSGLSGGFGSLKEQSDKLTAAIKEATTSVILFAAKMARLFGLESVVDSIKRTFAPMARGGGAIGAPREAGISDMASILRDATTMAFVAQGAGAKTQEEWLGDIDKKLEDVLGAQSSLNQIIAGAVNGVLRELGMPDAIANVQRIADKVAAGTELVPAAVRVRSLSGS